MKLLSSNFSPFSTRVRMQIAYKGLDIDIVAPEPALRTAEFREAFPLAKIPVLILDDGTHISESWSIMEYLEAAFPERSLTPDTPLGKAHASMMCRYADLYLGPALFPLFSLLLMGKKAEQDVVNEKLAGLKSSLEQGERLLIDIQASQGDTPRNLHTGDIALACSFYFALATPQQLGVELSLEQWPTLSSWWQWAQSHKQVTQGIDEMQTAFMAFLQNS